MVSEAGVRANGAERAGRWGLSVGDRFEVFKKDEKAYAWYVSI